LISFFSSRTAASFLATPPVNVNWSRTPPERDKIDLMVAMDVAGILPFVRDLTLKLLGAVVAVPSILMALREGLWAVAIVDSLKVRTAELLVERGITPPVITRASVVGSGRSQALFEAAYREHARRPARAIAQQGDADAGRQETGRQEM